MRRRDWSIVAVVLLAAAGLTLIYWPNSDAAVSTATAARSPTVQGATGGSRAPTVTTAEAETGSLPIRLQTIGWILSEKTTGLTSQQQGIVTEVQASEGKTVAEGDLLIKLDDRTATANVAKDQATLARDQATLLQAQQALAAAQSLYQKGSGTEQTFQQATATEKSAQATISLDQAALQADLVALDNTNIRAPFKGRLGAISVAPGTLIQPGTSVVTITQMSPVEVQFALSETDLPLLQSAMSSGSASVDVRGSGTQNESSGKISFVDSQVDRTSATVQARAVLTNDQEALWPGQSVDVSVNLGTTGPLTVVPTVAVQPAQNGSVVYVVGSDHRVDVRSVVVAGNDGDQTGISQGLKPGEQVVVEGQLDLTKGMQVAEAAPATPAAAAPLASNTSAVPKSATALESVSPSDAAASPQPGE